ncbi:MAG: hypothetical protein COU27_01545 [Candidatus Levybacteria bacterium CG10_big_fil_rev_8_21_14_0_10_36_7]|nr:MAG: hypothetical protein COU27_01545 [Candidatus Levybacteria bacterium CG10_big_fil_rev_8_21_14_0_10_36_7]
MKSKTNKNLILFMLVSLSLLAINYFFPLKFIQKTINNVFYFPKSFLYEAKAGISSGSESEIAKLKNENKILLQKLNDYETLKQDNSALKSQFQVSSLDSQNLIPAKIVGFEGPFSKPYAFIIDKGTNDGIGKQMTVIFENNLVGVVSEVGGSFSKVTLPASNKFSAVVIDRETSANGIVYGKEDFIFLDNVAVTDTLKVGDIIVTKGEINSAGLGVKNDIVVGKITSINKSDSESFQSAKIESLLDFSKLSTVFLAK